MSPEAGVETRDQCRGTHWVLEPRAVWVQEEGSLEGPHIHHLPHPSCCLWLLELAGAIALRSLGRGQH